MPPLVDREHHVTEAEVMAEAFCWRKSCSLCCSHRRGSRKVAAAAVDKEKCFPYGLRVLVVDGDTVCLAVLQRMLRQCHYNVTACRRVSQAISLIMENKDGFDIVMSDVYLPSEDGFKLLEVVGIGFDVPMIMMSANGDTNVVMRSITGGACNHLIKPIRMEELRTIWQHVVRRHGQQNHRYKLEDNHRDLSGHDRVSGESTASKKRKHNSVQFIQDINSLKTARVHWTDQLHRKFVKAVDQTGVDNAVPKRILEIMNIQGLTRENVASHLQKYRLYLKRLRGNIPEPRPVASFQAARDGKSGGTMQIRQRGKTSPSSSPLSSSSSALKAFPARLELTKDLDRATLKLLEQFQANEQKLAANQAKALRRLAAAAAGPSYRSTNFHLDQGYETGAELHIMNHVGWLRKNPQGDGGHRPSAVHDSAAQSFKVDFAELDKTKPPPRLFALSTNESQIQNPSATAKSLEEINIGKEEAKRSIDEPLYIDQEELLFNTFVEAEFRHVTVPPDHDQMPTLIAAAGDLPEEYLMLANNFLSKAV